MFRPQVSQAVAALKAKFMQQWQQHVQQVSPSLLPLLTDRFAWQSVPALWGLYCDFLPQFLAHLDDQPVLQQRVAYALKQWLAASAPTNYLSHNEKATQRFFATHGQSYLEGLQRLQHDVRQRTISYSDTAAFTVGRDVAATAGQVIYKNSFFELIHYTPRTAQVYATPLLIVPPCINKYYILDMQAHNSFVAYALAQGLQVFMISWRNPSQQCAIRSATWGDYLQHGVLRACSVVQSVSGISQIHTLGFCIGGTLLSSALAYAQARGEAPVASLTLLTAPLDFQEMGELGALVDEAGVQWWDNHAAQQQLVNAKTIGLSFALLRPRELIWNNIANRYLQGKSASAFDLLFWNADGTNVPAPFFAWYLRHCYWLNQLKEDGACVIDGLPLRLSSVRVPTYVYASEKDHIVPWQSAFRSVALLNAQRFVLGASGHIAGVISPPSAQHRYYWSSATSWSGQFPDSAKAWKANAQQNMGSWWPDWVKWLSALQPQRQPAASSAGNSAYQPMYAAPGVYVHQAA